MGLLFQKEEFVLVRSDGLHGAGIPQNLRKVLLYRVSAGKFNNTPWDFISDLKPILFWVWR